MLGAVLALTAEWCHKVESHKHDLPLVIDRYRYHRYFWAQPIPIRVGKNIFTTIMDPNEISDAKKMVKTSYLVHFHFRCIFIFDLFYA